MERLGRGNGKGNRNGMGVRIRGTEEREDGKRGRNPRKRETFQ